MTREEIEKVVKKYTNTDFEIVEVESDDDKTRVIIKFIDVEVAEHFVQDVNAAPERGERDLIKGIGFVLENISFSPEFHPMMLLLYLI